MNITFKQLSVFVSIVRHGSMTLAADSIFMTKGAVSQTLAELENQLGIRLFDRQHARLIINHEGKKLLPVADELLARVQGVEQLFDEKSHDIHLNLGCTKTIGSYVLPDMLTKFENKYGWLPQSVIANTQEIGGMLNSFEIDVALLEGPTTEPNLICEPWMEDEMVIIVSKNHPLAKEKIVSYETLNQESWILRERGSSSRAFFDNQLALHLHNPHVSLSLNAFDAILSCVRNNLGITFISNRILAQPFYKGHFVQLETEHRFYRKLTLCYHKSKFISPTLRSWIAFSQLWATRLSIP
ncbi:MULTISPECIES: LysR substrate-binding domain-containing protein [Yersinia]|uniref:LysR substrate-binding domain-containing protein n=1 Tax=Yersinia TaxID=629 RepID=UPI0005E96230|nr:MULTISPECIES: LysR substrate-binding domain-containing protein [Yersinia]OVZ94750.1 LysR family transcriptional regulator [Yersinia frederiksenii]RXA95489.1 LysR family transcriptional regulator [Yersinia sp. 2105 StPb PI]CNI04822.1 putative DNA-binding transcriptional regulator [Yersinia frederiksenii]CNI84575.1 putative DNA-binding transcriptional regulator [Yersinia frederiksenii]CNK94796.1 putative DNA-binding transcriptional regulator [Yersinia frederiksenii]